MKYDIIVIGAGSGGLNIAGFMNRAGFKVLLIDKSDASIGGDCLNYGCVPSKAVIHASRLAYEAKEAEHFGLKSSGKVDLAKVMSYVKSKKDVIRKHENATHFRNIGMDVALGKARFVSKNEVKVNGKVYKGKRIVLATGSRPRMLDVPGIEHVSTLTNETIFDLKKLPEHLLIVGGGPIGMELGQAFRRFGSKVTILEKGVKFLPKEDADIAKPLLKQLKKEGVEILFGVDIVSFPVKNKVVIKQRGKRKTLTFDNLLVSIGRQLNIEGLDLEKAGIEHDGRKVKVDEQLRTTNKHVFCCGDIAGGYQFTHAAELHAGVIISNFFSPKKKKLSNDHLSWVTYTSPEIATFGLNERQLKERNVDYEKLEVDFHDDDRAIVNNYTDGKLKVYLSKGKILGGSMVAMHAGELFQELVLANSAKLDVKHLFNKVYPYPTASRINKRLISQHFAKKLTEKNKKILKLLY